MARLGVGLQMTYIGSPMIFAGEELGFQGRDGEDSRRPMRWDRRGDWDTGSLQMFKDLIAIRHAHPALRRGGLRWVLAADDALGYVRETADERILMVLSRSPWSGALLPASLLTGAKAETIYGANDRRLMAGALVIPGDGPGVGIWRLSCDEGFVAIGRFAGSPGCPWAKRHSPVARGPSAIRRLPVGQAPFAGCPWAKRHSPSAPSAGCLHRISLRTVQSTNRVHRWTGRGGVSPLILVMMRFLAVRRGHWDTQHRYV